MLLLLPQSAGGANALLLCWLLACASTHGFIHSTPKQHPDFVLFAYPRMHRSTLAGPVVAGALCVRGELHVAGCTYLVVVVVPEAAPPADSGTQVMHS